MKIRTFKLVSAFSNGDHFKRFGLKLSITGSKGVNLDRGGYPILGLSGYMPKLIGYVIFFLSVLLFLGGKGIAADFTDNGDGTVNHKRIGLIWQKEDDNTTRTWENAISFCESLSLADRNDWRLPNIRELESIVDAGHYSPAINETYFPNSKSSYYWSSTTLAIDTSYAWYVNFSYGYVHYYKKEHKSYTRCVRGG